MNTLERTLHNTGTKCKVTGARDLSNVLKAVVESMASDGTAYLSMTQVEVMINSAVEKYEIMQLRKLK